MVSFSQNNFFPIERALLQLDCGKRCKSKQQRQCSKSMAKSCAVTADNRLNNMLYFSKKYVTVRVTGTRTTFFRYRRIGVFCSIEVGGGDLRN
jgi:hypothetical protein